MQRLTVVSGVVVAFILGVGALPALANEIVGNGGFEVAGAGGAADSAMWFEFTSDPSNISARDAAHPASGSWAHHLKANGLATQGTVAGLMQNTVNDVGSASLKENTSLVASFDAATPFGPGGVMNYTLRILNRTGAIVGMYNGFSPSGTGMTYQTYTTATLTVPAFGAAPNDLYTAYFEVNAGAGGFIGSYSEIYVDNVHIDGTLVPEPASLALLGLAGLLMRRR